MGQFSNTGSLCAHPYKDRRLIIATSIEKCEGNLRNVAHDLGYHRSHMYRLVYEHRLWAVFKKFRVERLIKERREREQRNLNHGI